MDADTPILESNQVRITSSGKIKNWVSFALQSFEKPDAKPISFHTRSSTKIKGKFSQGQNATPKIPSKQGAFLAPRLISVVEIVKREYLKKLEEAHSVRSMGLHQYNEFLLEDKEEEPEQDAETTRMAALALALEGKNHVRQEQSPYMRITLSPIELPHLVKNGATYQKPEIRKQSKSAKARAKKREKKLTAAAESEPEAGAPMPADS